MKFSWKTGLIGVLLAASLPSTALAYPHTYFQDANQWTVRDGNTWAAVPNSDWFRQHIIDAANFEVVVGVSTGPASERCKGCNVTVAPPRSFLPGNSITRAEFATLLARIIGKDRETAPAAPFRDTPGSEWYQQYLGPLVQANIVRLTDYYLDTFRPTDPISRREMAIWTGRAATAYGIGATPADLGRFRDGGSEVDMDLRRAVALEIIKGKTQLDGSVALELDGRATRVEATTMLMRVLPRFERQAPDISVLIGVVRAGFDAYAQKAREVHDKFMGEANGGTYVAKNAARFKADLSPYFSDLALEFIKDQRTFDNGNLGDIEPSTGWIKMAPSVLADLGMWDRGSNLTGMFVTGVSPVRILDRFAEVEVTLVYDDTKFTGDIERWTQNRRVFLAQQNGNWVMTATSYIGAKRELIRKK